MLSSGVRGKGGRMVANLLHGDIVIAAYCDINEDKWGTELDGVPIVSPDELSLLEFDTVFISMLNKDACASVKELLGKMEIMARLITAVELRETYDLRLAVLKMIAREVHERDIPGAVAELGVYQGAFASEMNRLFPERNIFLFDTFTGFDQRDVSKEEIQGYSRAQIGNFQDTSVDMVRQRMPHPERAVFKPGFFPESGTGVHEPFAVVSLDADLYAPLV